MILFGCACVVAEAHAVSKALQRVQTLVDEQLGKLTSILLTFKGKAKFVLAAQSRGRPQSQSRCACGD